MVNVTSSMGVTSVPISFDTILREFEKIPKKIPRKRTKRKNYLAFKNSSDASTNTQTNILREWYYKIGFIDISMPNYARKAITKLQHCPPTKPQHVPHKLNVPNFGKHTQYVQVENYSPKLFTSGIKGVQNDVGSFLFYA